MVGHILLFNVPRVFYTILKIGRTFMDPITAAKIEAHPSVPIDRLLALMPKATIPVEYGGECPADKLPQQRTLGPGEAAIFGSSPAISIT